MGDEMPNRKYRYHTFNLLGNLADKIEEVIASNEHGYNSIQEFVNVAISKYLRELGYIE